MLISFSLRQVCCNETLSLSGGSRVVDPSRGLPNSSPHLAAGSDGARVKIITRAGVSRLPSLGSGSTGLIWTQNYWRGLNNSKHPARMVTRRLEKGVLAEIGLCPSWLLLLR